MAINFPGPYEIRVNYTTTPTGQTLLGHQFRLSYQNANSPAPGSDFSAFDYVAKDSSTFDVESWLLSFIDLCKVIYPAATSFVDAEIWKYTAGTFDGQFQSSTSLAVVGTAGSPSQSTGQVILTFRSAGGGHGRFNLMESILAGGASSGFPTASTPINNIAAAFIADDALPWARDNSYFFSALRYHPGQNEALFKKRFRQL